MSRESVGESASGLAVTLGLRYLTNLGWFDSLNSFRSDGVKQPEA